MGDGAGKGKSFLVVGFVMAFESPKKSKNSFRPCLNMEFTSNASQNQIPHFILKWNFELPSRCLVGKKLKLSIEVLFVVPVAQDQKNEPGMCVLHC